MEAVWFVLVAVMITAYVVLDGFDLGAGVLHLLIARTEEERRTVIRTIGPVWDGNEVWLIAGGGTLYFAFPLFYASSFSGFYLPLNIVLWLLVLRGIGIEFRMHIENQVWQSLFDGFFAISSALLAIFFGAALGNVVRGVPLGVDHFFFEPLWTNFRTGADTGILDWYTCSVAVFALVALVVHGALYVALKTEGAVNEKSRKLARRLVALLRRCIRACWRPAAIAHATSPPSIPPQASMRCAWGSFGGVWGCASLSATSFLCIACFGARCGWKMGMDTEKSDAALSGTR